MQSGFEVETSKSYLHENKPLFSETSILAMLVVLSLIVTSSGFLTMYFSNSRLELLKKSIRFEALNGEIQKLDEVLTMSANMAAATGDLQWEARYNQFAPTLVQAIESLNAEFPEFTIGEETQRANEELVKMERESFELVKQDYLQPAKTILASKRYSENKAIYIAGMDKARKSLIEFQTYQLERVNFSIQLFLSSLIFFLLASVAISYAFFTRIRLRNRELKKISENLEQMVKVKSQQLALSSKLASLGEISAGIAHEINNPLAIIEGASQALMKSAGDPEKLNKRVESILKSTLRISKIVRGLKKFSRSDEVSSRSHVPINEIVEEAVSLIDHKSKLENTPVTVKISTEALILCNQIEIEQVIINLVGNAIDAAKKLPECWVRVSVYEEKEEVVLLVADSGPGIPEHILEKIYDPFFTTKKVGEGTGLGLSITKGIVDAHQAKISVLPKQSNTVFEVRFPKVVKGSSAA